MNNKIELTVLTTISPTNIQNQQNAIATWLNLGYDVKSLNSKSDIKKLKDSFQVEFIETSQLGNLEFSKDYVRLNAFTDWIKDNGSALIINSDIEMHGKIEIEPKEKELWVFSRNDYDIEISQSATFNSGYDAFYLTPELCSLIKASKLVIGQCHWDYFIPLVAIRNGFTLKSPKKSNLYHKKHELQYNDAKWKQTGKIFASELGLTGNVVYDSSKAHKEIKSKIIYH